MGLIDIIKPLLSTVLSSSAVHKPWQHQKNFGNAWNQTREGWAWSANATSVLSRTPTPSHSYCLFSIRGPNEKLMLITSKKKKRTKKCCQCFFFKCWRRDPKNVQLWNLPPPVAASKKKFTDPPLFGNRNKLTFSGQRSTDWTWLDQTKQFLFSYLSFSL